jgi:protein tyrosine/serine phosphatase
MKRGHSQFRPSEAPSRIFGVQFLSLVVLVISSSPLAARAAQSEQDSHSHKHAENPKVTIENFGKVCDHLYRGGQPTRSEYAELAKLGIKTVLDLRNDPKPYARDSSTASGLKYINLPMSDKDFPAPESAERFLSLVNDPANWPVFVHCAGGRHRTGAMTAVYRMTVDGWDIERAYREMKDYDFYTKWGHGEMKEYVFDYFSTLREKRAHQADSSLTQSAPEVSASVVGAEPAFLPGLLCPLSRYSSGREPRTPVRDPRTDLPTLLQN